LRQKNKINNIPIANYVNQAEQEIICSENSCGLIKRRKINPKKPMMAGNAAFRKHNNLRFMRTIERKQIGLKNKL
jgi:hypothetical protein